MSTFIRWKEGTDTQYALSIASTWVWAPALFVSSSMAHNNGIYGLLWFLIPNVLTLLLFGYITTKLVQENGYNVAQGIESADQKQKTLHKLLSAVLLVASTTVQMVGLHTVFSVWLGTSKITTLLITAILCFSMVIFHGIKACIKTDVIKYLILVICGVILSVCSIKQGKFVGWGGLNNPSFLNISISFGITSAIGLFCAPYVDNTFWQRAFCINKDKRFSVFLKSGLAFAIVPLLFALVGFFSIGGTDWSIGTAFSNNILTTAVILAVIAALVSTIDSNLCAISSLFYTSFIEENTTENTSNSISRIYMLLLFVISGILFCSTNLSVVQWFLLYGTARTSIAVSTLLILTKHYDNDRLFVATVAAVLISTFGYALTGSFVYTLLALLIPLLGYKSKIYA
jgi:Na+/proline symporter